MAACGNRERKETTDSSARVPDEQKFRLRLDEVNPGLRDPAAVIELIRMSGASFKADLVNVSGHDSIYRLDSALSALNLGIYTVDIGSC